MPDRPPGQAQVRLLVLAMAGGVVTFAAIVLLLGPTLVPEALIPLPGSAEAFIMALVVLLAVIGVAVGRKAPSGPRRREEDGPADAANRTRGILGAALAEGAGMFGVALGLVGARPRLVWWSAAMAIAALVLLYPWRSAPRRS